MSGKNIAIISYLTIIGWLIAFISQNNAPQKESIASFHLRQSLGIMLTGFVFTVIPSVFGAPFIGKYVGIAVFVLWILGLISAVKGEEKEVPVIGNSYQDWLKGIN